MHVCRIAGKWSPERRVAIAMATMMMMVYPRLWYRWACMGRAWVARLVEDTNGWAIAERDHRLGHVGPLCGTGGSRPNSLRAGLCCGRMALQLLCQVFGQRGCRHGRGALAWCRLWRRTTTVGMSTTTTVLCCPWSFGGLSLWSQAMLCLTGDYTTYDMVHGHHRIARWLSTAMSIITV